MLKLWTVERLYCGVGLCHWETFSAGYHGVCLYVWRTFLELFKLPCFFLTLSCFGSITPCYKVFVSFHSFINLALEDFQGFVSIEIILNRLYISKNWLSVVFDALTVVCINIYQFTINLQWNKFCSVYIIKNSKL